MAANVWDAVLHQRFGGGDQIREAAHKTARSFSMPGGPAPGILGTVSFRRGEADEELDVAQPVVEGEVAVIRHPARGQFPAVVELQVREARRVP